MTIKKLYIKIFFFITSRCETFFAKEKKFRLLKSLMTIKKFISLKYFFLLHQGAKHFLQKGKKFRLLKV